MDSNNQSTTNDQANQSTNNSTTPNRSLIGFMMQNKIAAALWFTRLFTIACTLAYIIPIFGYDPNTLYQKALMSNAATSALKLHQRVSSIPFQMNREYMANIFVEDSFHYLMYSFIFLNTQPVTIIFIPICVFALLHVVSYTLAILNFLNNDPSSFSLLRKFLGVVSAKDKDLMRFAALNEILITPVIFFMIFTGKCGILVPFIYYRFICMRYNSRRNPYNSEMFRELRSAIEMYTNGPSCPQAVKNLSQKLISFVVRLAPQ